MQMRMIAERVKEVQKMTNAYRHGRSNRCYLYPFLLQVL